MNNKLKVNGQWIDPNSNITKHFKYREFMGTNFMNWIRKNKPNANIIINMDFVRKVEEFRVALDSPIIITSGTRCCGYNATIKNASSNSEHIYGNAIDFKSPIYSPVELGGMALTFGFTGISIYSTWCHIDMRSKSKLKNPKQGYATWGKYMHLLKRRPLPVKQEKEDVLKDMTREELEKLIEEKIEEKVNPNTNSVWADEYFDFLKDQGIELHEKKYGQLANKGIIYKMSAEVLKANDRNTKNIIKGVLDKLKNQ